MRVVRKFSVVKPWFFLAGCLCFIIGYKGQLLAQESEAGTSLPVILYEIEGNQLKVPQSLNDLEEGLPPTFVDYIDPATIQNIKIRGVLGNFLKGQEIAIQFEKNSLPLDEENPAFPKAIEFAELPSLPGGTPLFDVKNISPNSVILTVQEDALFVISRGQADPGNAQKVVDYLREVLPIDPQSELGHAVQVLGILETEPLNQALGQMHPGFFGGLDWENLLQTTAVSMLLARHTRELLCAPRTCAEEKCSGRPKAIWANTYAIWSSQEKIGELEGFRTDNVGVVLGCDRRFGHGCLGAAVGYGHTHISWDHDAGGGRDNRVFGALYASYRHEIVRVNFSAMGGGNFYALGRNVAYIAYEDQRTSVQYQANSHPVGITADGHLGIGATFERWNVPVQLAGKVDYVYLHRPSFQEEGASELNLDVQTRNSSMLQTELGLEYAPTFQALYSCVSPYLGLAWVVKVPLSSSRIGARFVGLDQSIVVSATSHSSHLIVPSFGFKVSTVRGFSLALSAKAELSGQMKNYFTDLRLEYCF